MQLKHVRSLMGNLLDLIFEERRGREEMGEKGAGQAKGEVE